MLFMDRLPDSTLMALMLGGALVVFLFTPVMIRHVWERACRSSAARVVIATDDERILAAARGFGAEVCLTASHHQSGTDRLQEVVVSPDIGAASADHVGIVRDGSEGGPAIVRVEGRAG